MGGQYRIVSLVFSRRPMSQRSRRAGLRRRPANMRFVGLQAGIGPEGLVHPEYRMLKVETATVVGEGESHTISQVFRSCAD